MKATDAINEMMRLSGIVQELQAENAKLRWALEFYGDEYNYKRQPYADTGDAWKPIEDDEGCIARAALEGKK